MQQNYYVGHEIEQQYLLNLFEQTSIGKGGIMLVEGLSGCGKSALINNFLESGIANKPHCTIRINCKYCSAMVSYYGFCCQILGSTKADSKKHFFATADYNTLSDWFFTQLCNIAKKEIVVLVVDDFQYCNPDIYPMIYSLASHIHENKCGLMAIVAYNMLDYAIENDCLINRIKRGLFSIKIENILKAWDINILVKIEPSPLKMSDIAYLLNLYWPNNQFANNTSNTIFDLTNGNPALTVALIQNLASDGTINKHIVVNPKKLYKYRKTHLKLVDGKPKQLLQSAIDAADKASMVEALEYAEDTIFALKKYGNSNTVFEYLAVALQVKHRALYWLGFGNEAVETAMQLLKQSKIYNNDYYESAAYYYMGLDYLFLSDYQKADQLLNKSLQMVSHNPEHPAIADCYHALGKMCALNDLYQQAKDYFVKAYNHYHHLGDNEKMALVNIDLATIEIFFTNDYDKLLSQVQTSINYFADNNKLDKLARTYMLVANIYIAQSSIKLANECVSKALKLSYANADKLGVVICYSNLGSYYSHNHNYELALKYMFRALSNISTFNDISDCLTIYSVIGVAKKELNDYVGAEKYFNMALDLARSSKNITDLSQAYSNLGMFYAKTNKPKSAIKNYNAALKIDHKLNNRQSLFTNYNLLGNVYSEIDETNEALECYKNCFYIAKEQGDNEGIALMYNNIGNLLLENKKYDDALHYYTQALEINTELNDPSAISLNFYNIGNVYQNQNNYVRAETYFEKALDYAKKGNNINRQCSILERLALINFRAAKVERVLEYTNEAQQLYFDSGNMRMYYDCMRKSADCLRMLEKFNSAESKLKECISGAEKIGDLYGVAQAYSFLGAVYLDLDNLLSLEYAYRKSMYYYQQVDDFRGYGDALSSLAQAYCQSAQLEKAISCFSKLVNWYKKNNDLNAATETILYKASCYETNKEYQKAIKCYSDAAKFFGNNNEPMKQADALYNIGLNYIKCDKKVSALSFFKQADNIYKSLDTNDTKKLLVRNYTTEADLLFDIKLYDRAIEYYKLALEIDFEIKDYQHLAFINNNIGYTYDTMCNYTEALNYYLTAYNTYLKAPFANEGIFNNLKNAALMYDKIGETTLAIKYYKKAYSKRYKQPETKDIRFGECALSAANLLKSVAKYHEARKYYVLAFTEFENLKQIHDSITARVGEALTYVFCGSNQCEVVCKSLMLVYDSNNDIDVKCHILCGIAEVNLARGNIDFAISNFQKAISMQLERDYWHIAASYYIDMALLFVSYIKQLPNTITFLDTQFTKIDFIIKLFNNAKCLAHSEQDYELEVLSYSQMANLYLKTNNIDQATKMFNTAIDLAIESCNAELKVTAFLDKAGFLCNVVRDFRQSEYYINLAVSAITNSDFDLDILCNAYYFMLFVAANRIAEATEVYNNYKVKFLGLNKRLPLLNNYVQQLNEKSNN